MPHAQTAVQRKASSNLDDRAAAGHDLQTNSLVVQSNQSLLTLIKDYLVILLYGNQVNCVNGLAT